MSGTTVKIAKIILCRGLQASGKTTWSLDWLSKETDKDNHRVRFNNDDLRHMIGNYHYPNDEELVRAIRNIFMCNSISKGYDIVVDNMNLSDKTNEYYNTLISNHNDYILKSHDYSETVYVLKYQNFPISLEEAILRDSKREHPIGSKAITNSFNQYKSKYPNLLWSIKK